MKLENFKEKNSRRNRIIIGVLVGVSCLGIAYVLTRTFASLRVESDSYVIMEGVINGATGESVENQKIYVNDGYVKALPEKGSGLIFSAEKSHCAVSIDTLEWDYAKWDLYGNPVINNCELHFLSPTSDKIITDKSEGTLQEIKDAISKKTIDYKAITHEDNGLVLSSDDFGNSYAFRGKVENNYFLLDGNYYRIIRINGDGSIRLIYEGKNEEGKENSYLTVAYNLNNQSPAYNAYMFGNEIGKTYEDTIKPETNANIKTILENWYEKNIVEKKLASYIADEIYCNNKTILSGNGYTDNTVYKNSSWLETNTPSLTCEQDNDKYTVSNHKGNGKNKYPVGLITVDELIIAGLSKDEANIDNYLVEGNTIWTMSSDSYTKDNGALNYALSNDGKIITSKVNEELGVRPVINIRADIPILGDGTKENPYQIQM